MLPLVIQLPERALRLFELPAASVLEVPLSHPRYPWFAELGLKWHALPAVSDMRMEIGGIAHSMAPFNGWYMGTEIGTRNLGDEYHYDMLPVKAEHMRLDTSDDTALWRDRALIELNQAVVHSFAITRPPPRPRPAGRCSATGPGSCRRFRVRQRLCSTSISRIFR